MKTEDLTNRKFGRLTVSAFSHIQTNPNGLGVPMWICICDCSNIVTIRGPHLKSGATQSCGCYRNEQVADALTTHGASVGHKLTSEYMSWRHAKERCFNTNGKVYRYYGGRGITMCNEWVNDFDAFLRHIGPRPAGTTLDRINNDGNYEPGNVRWATRSQQSLNRRKYTSKKVAQ